MKRLCAARLLAVVCVGLVLLAGTVSAHPGRTDANGGHYDSSTGLYHYHHGYPAHQHENGVCPYEYDDQTGTTSGSVAAVAADDAPEAAPPDLVQTGINVDDNGHQDGYSDEQQAEDTSQHTGAGIMAYFVSILFIFAFWVPFVFVLNFIFYALQIPFALIHRYAVYVVMLFKIYLQAAYLSLLCLGAAAQYEISVFPLALVFLPALYFETLRYFRNSRDENTLALGRTAIWFAPLVFIATPYIFSSKIVAALLSVQQFTNTLASFNTVTLWITYIFGFVCLVFALVRAALYLVSLGKSKSADSLTS